MITVYFVRNGSKIPVEVDVGASLMEAAKFFSKIDIPEIPADCGGACACATCHVYIDDRWLGKHGKVWLLVSFVKKLQHQTHLSMV